jgi:maltose/moltooligosaccharide transporter
MFANYNLIAALAAFITTLAKYTSRNSRFIALVCGGLGLISIYFIQNQQPSLWNGFQ